MKDISDHKMALGEKLSSHLGHYNTCCHSLITKVSKIHSSEDHECMFEIAIHPAHIAIHRAMLVIFFVLPILSLKNIKKKKGILMVHL